MSSSVFSSHAFLARIKHWTGLDRAIAFTVMARFWSAIAGVITVLLIARLLTPSEQGYYYTFSSLVALQIVFELGFSFVILQMAAHERARLKFMPDGQVEGDRVAQARLASVLQKSVRWYSMAALLMVATLVPAGFYFFSVHQLPHELVAWKAPWCMVAIAASLTFQIDPVFSFLEGCGFVSEVARMRLGQAMAGSILAWIAMAAHHGLFSPAMVIVGQATVGMIFLFTGQRRGLLKGLLLYPVGEFGVGWRREIWSFQWRIAVSVLSGYFIFQFFNPVLFAYQGPIAAGRMGMSLSISASLGAVAMAWMNTKASPFGNLIARGEVAALDRLFFRTLWQSTFLIAIGAAGLFLCLLAGGNIYPKLAARVLTPWAFGLLLLTMVANQIIFSEALYLRAHKREPFLLPSVIGALLLCSSTWVLGRLWGANAVTVGYFLCTALVGLPWGTYIFLTKRHEWHELPATHADAMSMVTVSAEHV